MVEGQRGGLAWEIGREPGWEIGREPGWEIGYLELKCVHRLSVWFVSLGLVCSLPNLARVLDYTAPVHDPNVSCFFFSSSSFDSISAASRAHGERRPRAGGALSNYSC